jgi:hypothetical protein
MANGSTIISGEMKPKILCPKVDEKVAIPRVVRGYEEEVFIGKILIYG